MSWGEETSDWAITETYESTNVKKPPFWPLILQLLLLISSALMFFTAGIDDHLSSGLICYLLTPLMVVVMLAILRAKDFSNRSLEHYDSELGKSYIRYASLISLVSFIFAVAIIWRLGIEIGQIIAVNK